MKKKTRAKLALELTTIRQLSDRDLSAAVGGAYGLGITSTCNPCSMRASGCGTVNSVGI